MDAIDFSALHLLLKAQSKDVVSRLCDEVNLNHDTSNWTPALTSFTSNSLSISNSDSHKVLSAMKSLERNAIFKGLSTVQEVMALFPGDFHKSLSELIAKIFADRLPRWKEHSINNLVFLPKLVDFDWRVDIKTSSDSVSRMSIPTCLLQFQVQELTSQSGTVPPTSCVNVELSRQTLDTMLDGLGKIRDQLSSVAKT